MSSPGIKLKGNTDLIRGFVSLRQFRQVKAAISAAGVHIKGVIAKYTESSSGNAPGPYPKRWYERGYGPRWARAAGGVGGSKTSETLGRKWTTRARNNGFGVVVGNNVSYGPFVQGEETQNLYHKSRGWMTDQDVIDQEGPHVEKLIGQAIELALKNF